MTAPSSGHPLTMRESRGRNPRDSRKVKRDDFDPARRMYVNLSRTLPRGMRENGGETGRFGWFAVVEYDIDIETSG